MKSFFKFRFNALNALLSVTFSVLLLFACKNSSAERATSSKTNSESVNSTTEKNADAGALERKFIKTTDMKFRVDDVQRSTDIIEKTIKKAGGFVSKMQLESDVTEKKSSKLSLDSIIETTKFLVSNTITIRVPSQNLDRALDTIVKQIRFLDSKNITQDDVSLQILSNQLKSERNSNSNKRITKAIDAKGKNLEKIVDAEKNVLENENQQDETFVNNLNLDDQVNYSTLSFNIYQREKILQEKFLDISDIDTFRPHFGIQIWESLTQGWWFLEATICFIFRLWSVFLIAIFGYMVYKNRHKRILKKVT